MLRTRKSVAIISSFVLAAAVFILTAIEADFRSAIIFAYGIWAWFWGVALMWPALRSQLRYKGSSMFSYSAMLWLSESIVGVIMFGSISLAAGVLGGGIYQFVRYLRSSSET